MLLIPVLRLLTLPGVTLLILPLIEYIVELNLFL